MGYVVIGAEVLVGVVFAVAASSKLRGAAAFKAFVRSLWQLRLLPRGLVRPVAVLVVGTELLVPSALLAALAGPGWLALLGLAAAAGLLLVFTAGIVLALRRGTTAPCRCFGSADRPLGRRQVVRNVLLTAIAVLGLVGTLTGPAAAAGVPGVLLAVLGGAVIAGVLIVFDDIVDVFDPDSTSGITASAR